MSNHFFILIYYRAITIFQQSRNELPTNIENTQILDAATCIFKFWKNQSGNQPKSARIP